MPRDLHNEQLGINQQPLNNIDVQMSLHESESNFSRDTRARANYIELKSHRGEKAQTLGETLKDGGILFDFGSGNGELGALLASRHSMTLIQSDVVDMPTKTDGSYIRINRDEPPNFGNSLMRVVDNVLLVNVLNKVIYKEMDPVSSKVALLKSLATLLTESGKILVVADSSAATGEKTLEVMMQVRDSIINNEVLKDKIEFYTP